MNDILKFKKIIKKFFECCKAFAFPVKNEVGFFFKNKQIEKIIIGQRLGNFYQMKIF